MHSPPVQNHMMVHMHACSAERTMRPQQSQARPWRCADQAAASGCVLPSHAMLHSPHPSPPPCAPVALARQQEASKVGLPGRCTAWQLRPHLCILLLLLEPQLLHRICTRALVSRPRLKQRGLLHSSRGRRVSAGCARVLQLLQLPGCGGVERGAAAASKHQASPAAVRMI